MDVEPQIFVSYRRGDVPAHAGRLYDALIGALGKSRVFFDVGSIHGGAKFAEVIYEALRRAEVVITVIGPAWLTVADEHGVRRLDDPEDFVRQELGFALGGDVPIVPVLVDNAAMPARATLPTDLAGLADFQAERLDDDAEWVDNVRGRLLERVRALAADVRARREAAAGGIRLGGMFGPYRLDELLEDDRYRAYDTEQGRPVVVEIRGAADAGFAHTAAALAALDDPHLVPILGHGEHNGRRYLVAALPDGIRLPALTGVSALSAARAVAAVEDIAAALEVLRANGIGDVHLLPTDVWLAPGVSGAIVRLLPFGAFPGRPDPRYTAPERLRGKQFDERADVYALACLLFECLTGRPPYPGATAEAVITGHLRKSRPHLIDAPAALDDVVRRALAKKPAERIATPRTLVVSARAALGGPPAVVPTPAVSSPARIVDQFVGDLGTFRVRGARARAAWSTPALRVGAALALLGLAACWVAGAVWLGGLRDKQAGDPFAIDGVGVLLGLIGQVFAVAVWGGVAAAVTFLIVVVRARRRSPSWAAAFEASTTRPAMIVGGLTAAFVGLFLPLVALASIARSRQVPGAMVGDALDYALGLIALAGLNMLALFSATCWFALRERVVHTSQSVADRQFPLFVGAVALVAAAVAIAVGGWVGIGIAAVVIVLCVGCLVVEVFDRASTLPGYLGGVAMTVAAGGGAVAAFALL